MPEVVNLTEKFQFNPVHLKMLERWSQFRLSVGGIRSGKTLNALMFGIHHYLLRFSGCNMLVLRRTFKELESGAIADFKAFVDPAVYDYNASSHVATFKNGSKLVFGHCNNNTERSIEQYLGTAYPFILVDECGQFSADAWELLSSRNVVNPECLPADDGSMPIPSMWGCTNPIGPHWSYYDSLFHLQEPYIKPEGVKKDVKGCWWIQEAGEWRLVYNPADYQMQRTTVFDNPHILRRDPGFVERLNKLPKAKRDKMLYGLLDKTEGSYYDCFDPEYHVVNTREDPEAIVWQPWQPVWCGWDFGLQHWSSVYWFTKALVKNIKGEYKLKTVCFRELVTQGVTGEALALLFALKSCRMPDGSPLRISAIYFSYEKFQRQLAAHSPAVEYTALLRRQHEAASKKVYKLEHPESKDGELEQDWKTLPALSPSPTGPGSRIARATYVYTQIKEGKIVILDTCPEIIRALPTLQRNPDNLDDVLKPKGASKPDDCYDGFSYGLYGNLFAKPEPAINRLIAQAGEIDDLLEKHFFMLKQQKKFQVDPTPVRKPVWDRRE